MNYWFITISSVSMVLFLTGKGESFLFLLSKMAFRTYFVYFHTFSRINSKSNEHSLGPPVDAPNPVF